MVSADKARHSVHFVPEEKHLFCGSRYKDIPVCKTCTQLLIQGGGMLHKNCNQVNAPWGVPLSATIQNIFLLASHFLSCIQKGQQRGCLPPRSPRLTLNTSKREGGSVTEALFTTCDQTYMADSESCWWFFRFLFCCVESCHFCLGSTGCWNTLRKAPAFSRTKFLSLKISFFWNVSMEIICV